MASEGMGHAYVKKQHQNSKVEFGRTCRLVNTWHFVRTAKRGVGNPQHFPTCISAPVSFTSTPGLQTVLQTNDVNKVPSELCKLI